MTLPVPTIDHVVINVQDRMDEAQALYQRLGFALTPRGHHTLGSINHLAIFGTEYLELVGLPKGATGRADLLDAPTGLNGLVWATEDSATVHATLTGLGVAISEPGEFSRPVTLASGTRDAVFRTVRLPKETTEAGRLYFCHHFTRDLVWRDEWRHHPNGTTGVIRAVISAHHPERLGALFRKMFGEGAVRKVAGGLGLVCGLTNIDVVSPGMVARRYGPAAPVHDNRHEVMAALVLRTRSVGHAAAVIKAPGTRLNNNRLVVPASETMGVTLEFQE